MEPRVGVRLLGGVQVERDGEIEQPGGRLGRSLLALLALRPGSPVRVDVLIDELWGESLPRNPPAALRVQVSRLRTVLDRPARGRPTAGRRSCGSAAVPTPSVSPPAPSTCRASTSTSGRR